MSALLAPSLIFGGCCSNVYALEAILKHDHGSGLLITLMQFIIVALSVYPSQASASRPPFFVRKTGIPMPVLFKIAAMFFAVNMLNNWAFAFDISVPVHIILRSFGSVTTMAAGWLKGKRYTPVQVLSVFVLTLGVMISAWADAKTKGKKLDTAVEVSDWSFVSGLGVLLVAQSLSSYMGICVQDTYARYGKHWRENLFYSHVFSLPLFLPLQPLLATQYHNLQYSPPLTLPPALARTAPALLTRLAQRTPSALAHLALNSTTQLACITGVNVLGARASAVTVTIVLNVRKLVSFLLSVWLFGNPMGALMGAGAALVFGAGALYGWETAVRGRRASGRVEGAGEKKEL